MGGGDTGVDNSRIPGSRLTSTTTGNKVRGLYDGAAVNSEGDIAGGAGMA